MRLGYNTNGFAHHRRLDALEVLAEIGYTSVAITIDHHCLDPFSPNLLREIQQMQSALARLRLASVIETGARFLLNPRVKHEPTLVSPTAEGRNLRVDFLRRAIDIAADLGSNAVSFWSGVVHEIVPPATAFDRLTEGCEQVVAHAAKRGVKLAFEPEPGMLIESFAQYRELLARVDAPHFGLTIDIGHVHCVEEGSISDYLREWSPRLFNIHIEDMKRGIHEHLPFGAGEIDFPPVMQTLREIGYAGGVHVELSRHSHAAPDAARDAFEFLTSL